MSAAIDVIVIGAGVAGLSAASVLAQQGAKVQVLERRPYVGGRAYSYLHPALEEVVDSQHVLLGCCTNLLRLIDDAGVADKVRWYDRQTFLEPGDATHPTRNSVIERNSLPAPFQYADSFPLLKMLGVRDKLAIARGLLSFAGGNHGSDAESVAAWYGRTHQTDRAIHHFWEPIILATLNDSAERCSMRYAGKVFYELFLKTSTGGRLGIPTVPLSDFYAAGANLVERLGSTVEYRVSVERIGRNADGAWHVHAGERDYTATNLVLATPFEQTRTLLATLADEPAAQHILSDTAHFIHAPFISVLLWFDRQITDLHHAWLLDTTIQWFFHKSSIRSYPAAKGSYVEVILAGSRRELAWTRAQLLELALEELARFFPIVREATLLKSGILKEARATFSVTPGLDPYRSTQQTGLSGLFLAGDWTCTDWPSTMEGAARSGRLAAGAVLGDRGKFLVPELPAAGLMHWLEAKP